MIGGADGSAMAMLRVLGCTPMRRLSGLWVLSRPHDPTQCLAFDDNIFLMHVGDFGSVNFSVGSHIHSGACSSTCPNHIPSTDFGSELLLLRLTSTFTSLSSAVSREYHLPLLAIFAQHPTIDQSHGHLQSVSFCWSPPTDSRSECRTVLSEF